ncbi:MAG: prepilin peptidase, partial [Dehalococcoidales bacterium]|nr:prepilin peptidase [Dehalococcoidales bacterium]
MAGDIVALLTEKTKTATIGGMEAVWMIVFALLGIAVGSFLNVCIDRLPENQSLIAPPSHCSACQKRLSFADLIPVFSYLWLRGRCRHCQASIPRRILWVEIATGAAFAFLFWHYGLSGELAVAAFYFCLFIVLLVIDLEHHILPNRLVYPGAAVAMILSVFLSRLEVVPGIASAAAGGGIGLGIFLLIVVLSRGGMGWGDVKMAALIGMVTGYPLIFVAILLAVVSGGLVAWILILSKAKSRKQGIPFGPFLSLAA